MTAKWPSKTPILSSDSPNFFATDQVLSNSKKGLKNSAFELISGSATLIIWNKENQEKQLKSVFPQIKGKRLDDPLKMKEDQRSSPPDVYVH
ncbi:MAG TPA: hypothetical protein VHA33_06530 [Candidatus Angelobacter sp.]|nr:hypothetical protein [Candidatus Angelobacter sp.]